MNAVVNLDDFFDYDNKTEEEISDILPEGEYKFEVAQYELQTSKTSGLPMIKLTLRVYDNKGGSRLVNDYLIKTLAYKVLHFCQATGLEKEYADKTFKPSLCAARTGRVKLKVEIDKTGQYGPKNSVKDYVKASAVAKTEGNNEPFFNDDIPF